MAVIYGTKAVVGVNLFAVVAAKECIRESVYLV